MKHSRRVAPWLMAALAAGCVAAPAPTPPVKLASRPAPKVSATPHIPATGSFVSNGGANVVSNNTAGLSGTLMGPKAALIANHGAGIISNNAGGLLGNNGSNWRVLALSDLSEPVGGATIVVTDEGGRSLLDTPVTSNADGSFKLEALKPSGPVVFVKATYTREGRTVTLLAAAPAPRAQAVPVSVDPASTLVAKKLLEMVRLGAAAGQDFKPEGLKAVADAIAPAVTEQVAVAAALLPETTVTKVFDALVTRQPAIKEAVEKAAGGSGLTPLVDETPVAPPSASPSASPSSTGASTPPESPSASPSDGGLVSNATPTPAPNGLQVTTFAGNPAYRPADGAPGTAVYNGPLGLDADAAGNLYVADTDNHMIRKIAPNGTTTTVAGNGLPGYQDGVGTGAQFHQPTDVAVAADGTLYVADNENDCIRKISPDGEVSTFAGAPGNGGFADGQGASARFSSPTGVAIGSDGHVYVADTKNNRIRHIDADGVVTTVAGTGAAGKTNGAGESATFHTPTDLAFKDDATVVVSDAGNGLIRSIASSGQVSNYLATIFKQPHGLAFDASGNLYVSENSGHMIRKVTPAKAVSVLAGGDRGFLESVGGSAQFNAPAGLAVIDNKVFVADALNHRIRQVALGFTASVTTYAGGKMRFADGQGTAALFNQPEGLALGKDGTLYVADSANFRLRAVSPSGAVRTELGGLYGGTLGYPLNLSFKDIKGLAVDTAGTLFLTDSADRTVRKFAFGVLTTLAGNADGDAGAGFSWPRGLTVTPDGTIFVVDGNSHLVRRVASNGTITTFAGKVDGFADGPATVAKFSSPHAIARDGLGNFYVADAGNNRIRKIAPDGTVSTLAGGERGDADGPGTSARFRGPEGLALAPDGAVIVADTGNHRLRRIATDGTVTTLAGSSQGHADGPGNQARFSSPVSVVVDGQGVIYVTDFATHCIRKVAP